MLGAGTQASPYLVSTPTDLNAVKNNLTAYYELANNIDMSTFGNFSTIGKSTVTFFKGTFDGKGHKIKNLTINEATTTGYVGLFGFINTSTTVIKNVGLENCNISGGNLGNWVGLVGQVSNGSVENCYTTGQIVGKYIVGGIVGQFAGGSVKNCYSTATITGFARIGGLIGNSATATGIVDKCYSTGFVTATETANATLIGGLISNGSTLANVTNCYWNTQTSGQTTSTGGTGKTTAEMKIQSTYTSWDFSTIWGINNDYPYLQVFGLPPKVITITVNSFSKHIFSGTNNNKKSTKQLQTYTKSIQTSLGRHSKTFKNVDSYLSQINSNVIQSHRTVKSTTQNILSYISPIYSSVYRESKTIKHLLATVNSLEGSVSVVVPMNTKGAYAYVSMQENPSVTSYSESMSNVSYIENPSYCEVN
jgi:hypothetical protein